MKNHRLGGGFCFFLCLRGGSRFFGGAATEFLPCLLLGKIADVVEFGAVNFLGGADDLHLVDAGGPDRVDLFYPYTLHGRADGKSGALLATVLTSQNEAFKPAQALFFAFFYFFPDAHCRAGFYSL